ncbi:3'(2'),5'-bisphosphate nucleotidase CysQ [Paracoccus aerodenitrificans]|uniref:3'(2'),5'-bisphosphate nucleotidase CysQ n=1 Tax=Paracoccus aerodenitrificans TaxID=3017781 RepID=UPI0022F136B8|nr:3'(2'),5'-bisphosphate nucleotidase CysQ [Paracoccus aerodenitrificans]WBU63867.1 3'(2'),5'-bisphosphate nucleotidase CysQ [Paracoccus aerodenitrificans]
MPERDLKLLIEAAQEAGEIAHRFWRQDPETWEKDAGAGPVTEADLAVNEHLFRRLTEARPNYGWLSEESEDEASRLDASHCFIIDPIDGTRAFIDGQQGFSHSLAIARGDHVVAAVVHLPEMGLTYTASEEGPAMLNGTPIRPSDATLADADILASKSVLDPGYWKDRQPPGFKRSFRPSLAWRLCLVAEGRFDAIMSLRSAWEWDIAAGALIAARAGAVVTNMHGKPMRFNGQDARIDGVVIAGPALHGQIMENLAQMPGA